MELNGRWSELSALMTSCLQEMSGEFEDFEKKFSWISTVAVCGWVFRIFCGSFLGVLTGREEQRS